MFYKNLDTEDVFYEFDGNILREQWCKVSGYELYHISNLGRLKSFNRGGVKIMKQFHNADNYLSTSISLDGKNKTVGVHRLVGLHFVPNPLSKPEVNHLDGVRDNNVSWNLGWATDSEQQIHSYTELGRIGAHLGKKGSQHPMFGRSGILSKSSKPVLCLTNGKEYISATEAAKDLNLKLMSVCEVCRGAKNSLYGFKFRYL